MTDTTKHKISVDIDSFTVGDFIDFEDVAGMPLTDAMKKAQAEESLSMKAMLALLWIAERQDGKTLDDVRGYRISELDIEFVGGEDAEDEGEDPQPAGSA